MGTVGGPFGIHRHGDVIQGQRCILTGADGHPVPFCRIRCGANAVHQDVAVLKPQGLSPQGNTILHEIQCVGMPLFACNGQILGEVQTVCGAVAQQHDGIPVGGGFYCGVKRGIFRIIDPGDHRCLLLNGHRQRELRAVVILIVP